MADRVFKITYEVLGDGVLLAEAHVAAVKAASDRCLEIAHDLGADGYRPDSRNSCMGSLIFKDGQLRSGLRRFSPRNQEQGIDFLPRKDKSGEKYRSAITSAPKIPTDRDLVKQFGWDNDYGLTDGYRIFFSTFSHIRLPRDRYFIRIPRTADDGYVPPTTLVEVSEGIFMRAIADHNDAVAALKAELV